MKPADDKLWAAGVHEAGHVIAGLAVGIGVRFVMVQSDGSGLCQPQPVTVSPRLNAVFSAGGRAADRLFGFRVNEGSYADDAGGIVTWLAELPDHERDQANTDIHAEAARIIAERQGEVQTLARALASRHILVASEIKAILELEAQQQ